MRDKTEFPERLRIRDTELHDDMGGLGQRIYTTAGTGYEKCEYVRVDLFDRLAAENAELRLFNSRGSEREEQLRAKVAELEARLRNLEDPLAELAKQAQDLDMGY